MRLTRPAAACGGFRIALLSMLLLVSPRAARATSCVEGSLERSFARADAVFLGVVESSRPSFRHPLTMVANRVRVLRAWKGVTEDRVTLLWELTSHWTRDDMFWQAARGASPFGGSDTLLVAAWRIDGELVTGFCAVTTTRYGGAEREMVLLGPGMLPTARASVVDVGLWWPWPVVIVAALLAGAGVLRLRRQGH